MINLGLCTHFTETDEWAFTYALKLAKAQNWQMTICHWLESPYIIRRDIVYDSLIDRQETVAVTPKILTKLELQFREYYEPKLGDFTEVAFNLCEGFYQVELERCFRNNLLDIVVMGYQTLVEEAPSNLSVEAFAAQLQYPLLIVGQGGPDTFLLNQKAFELLDQLMLPEGSWRVLEPVLS